EPYAIMNEAEALRDKIDCNILERLSIHKDAVVITPYHWIMNRAKEIDRATDKDKTPHGSCGMGVGEARADELSDLAIRAGNMITCLPILKKIRDKKIEEAQQLLGSESETIKKLTSNEYSA